jgi:hypothetical protein
MEMQPIDPNKPITAELSAQEWNALLTAATSEHLVASPSLVNKLMAQLRQQVTAPMATEEMAASVPPSTGDT